MIRTFKYRLYPNKKQGESLDFLLWQGRTLYNAALEQRIAVYKETGKGISYPEQWIHFRDLRNDKPDTLGKLNATSVQQMLRRLDKSFAAFFRRLKTGEKPGFPRFKGRDRFHSLEFSYGDGCKLREKDGRTLFYVQNVDELKVKYHRPLPPGAQIKHVILKRNLEKWYVSLSLEIDHPMRLPFERPAVGLDMGLSSLLAFSDGQTMDNPRWLRGSLQSLCIAQRRLSRRIEGSYRRRKAAFLVAQHHGDIQNQRRDFWHKTTRQIADTYGLVAIEDLTLEFMLRNHHLALSASDAGLGEFQQLLRYKVEETGGVVVAVNPRNTSQVCSGCGVLVPKDLKVRLHSCPDCGLVLDRDVNAARNILTLALLSPGRGDQASTWADLRLCVA